MPTKKRRKVTRILQPLALGWRLGVALRLQAYRRGWLKTRRLSHPVVSVGNLTVGGTGKTPFVAWLTERLQRRGLRPAILTRGYKRRSRESLIALEPSLGRAPDPRQVGDEPAWLARALPQVPIVLGADRYAAGRLAEQRFGVDVHILDDGFQYLSLARDMDIVLLDVTQEFSDRALIPAGRLREPCSALTRAHVVVLTRVDHADPKNLEEQVRRINPRADVYHASTELCALRDLGSNRQVPSEGLRGAPVMAFCGIGNPQAFLADVKRWGYTVAGQSVFPDHHVYTNSDVASLQARARQCGAKALVTTEKDSLNLPPNLPAQAGLESAMPLFTCIIRIEVHESERLEDCVVGRLKTAATASGIAYF